jgi:hypothetical protein
MFGQIEADVADFWLGAHRDCFATLAMTLKGTRHCEERSDEAIPIRLCKSTQLPVNVMAGLGSAIHESRYVDARHKAGHDEMMAHHNWLHSRGFIPC